VRIVVNGEERDVVDGLTVTELVCELGRDPDRPGVAVAIGGQVVRRADWSSRRLEPGDVVEIVDAVQGGST
jgi:sulfur carrier protein